MTFVEFNFTDIMSEPKTGSVTFTPVRNNRHSHGVTLPGAFAINLGENGNFTAELKPTPAHWLWRINIQVSDLPWKSEYYYIPDRNFPIRYEDLTPVDPSTVQTGLNPEPAWWAHTQAVKASADEIAELTFQARTRIGETNDILTRIENARDQALEAIAEAQNVTARNLNRSEEILAEIHRLYTDIVGSQT